MLLKRHEGGIHAFYGAGAGDHQSRNFVIRNFEGAAQR